MSNPRKYTGIRIGSGVAIGPPYVYHSKKVSVSPEESSNTSHELQKLKDAIREATSELDSIKAGSIDQIGKEDAAIFDAHKLILNDPELLEKVTKRINGQNYTAAYAWYLSIQEYIDVYKALDSSVMVDRSADVEDAGMRVLRKLSDEINESISPDVPSILLCDDLTPSDTARIKPGNILGIVCTLGSGTSHSAIIARSLGIPAVFGIGGSLKDYPVGETVVLDGERGEVCFEPTPDYISLMQTKQKSWLEVKHSSDSAKMEPAKTNDGRRITVMANVSGAEEVKFAMENGADGIGLFRTEFLFMNRLGPPSEEEQFLVYRRAAELAKESSVTIRTLDVGGDKEIPYLGIKRENNPFLGLRGIRHSIKFPKIFRTQLRAIARASVYGNLSIMFPMITTLAEWKEATRILGEVILELDAEKIQVDPDLGVGIMVETPACVSSIREFLEVADFVSIGTNDLAQYTMATDRDNPDIGELASVYQPAVLKLIRKTIRAARDKAKPVAMCGEMGAETKATALLIGLGLRSFSMNASQIPEFKRHLRTLNLEKSKKLPMLINGNLTPEDVIKLI